MREAAGYGKGTDSLGYKSADHPSIHPPIHLFIYLSIHIFIYLSIYLSNYLSIYLCIYLWFYSLGRLRGPLGAGGSLTCSKFIIRSNSLKVPPGGLVPWIFPSLKIRPASLESWGGNATSRPRRPLWWHLAEYNFFFGLRILYKATDYWKAIEKLFYQNGLISSEQKCATRHELHKNYNILICMSLIRRVLVRMIGVINSLVTHSLLITLTH
jgi:hypothetical protein